MIPHISSALPLTKLPVADGKVEPVEHLLDFKTFLSLRRMAIHPQSKRLLNRVDFIRQVTLNLPEVAALIEESDFGIVHLEVGAMKLATQEAIVHVHFSTVYRHLNLIADLFEHADTELYDAIRISYLEALFLDETAAPYVLARRMLSRPLENILQQSELRLKKMRSASA